ncbi:MAG: TlyA family RNA methyltransferase [bacterium]
MKKRLDLLIVEKGLAPSRQKAQGMIMSGEVRVDGQAITKAGHMVDPDAEVKVESVRIPFVGRGGLKLDAALNHFGVGVNGKICMDVGSSTGGFTDCLLQRGAMKVYAIDVGYGLIDSKLRSDPRVILIERTNFRYIESSIIPECIDIATVDVSFISLMKIFPRLIEFLCADGEVLALVKPQFEVGKGRVGKGGIVREEQTRVDAVRSVQSSAVSLGLIARGVFESPVPGQKGNREYFLFLRKA